MIPRTVQRTLCWCLAAALSGAAAAQDSELISLIQSVQPRYYSFLPGPLELVPADKPAVVVAVTDLRLDDGPVVPAGTVLEPGQVVMSGILWNLGEAPVSVTSARGGFDTVLADELVVVDVEQPQEMLPAPIPGYSVTVDDEGNIIPITKQCSVSCGRGYYACAYELGSRAVCRCIRIDEPEPSGGCTAGGPGSSSCSVVLR